MEGECVEAQGESGSAKINVAGVGEASSHHGPLSFSQDLWDQFDVVQNGVQLGVSRLSQISRTLSVMAKQEEGYYMKLDKTLLSYVSTEGAAALTLDHATRALVDSLKEEQRSRKVLHISLVSAVDRISQFSSEYKRKDIALKARWQELGQNYNLKLQVRK